MNIAIDKVTNYICYAQPSYLGELCKVSAVLPSFCDHQFLGKYVNNIFIIETFLHQNIETCFAKNFLKSVNDIIVDSNVDTNIFTFLALLLLQASDKHIPKNKFITGLDIL